MTENESPCPIECPNRRSDGITLDFGSGKRVHLDPFELFLWFLLMLPCGVMIKEAFKPDYAFETAIGRVGAIATLAWTIRKAPTEEIYKWMLDKKLS